MTAKPAPSGSGIRIAPDRERPEWPCESMRLASQDVVVDVIAELVSEQIAPLAPERPAAWGVDEVHDHELPRLPELGSQRALPPLGESVLRAGQEGHERGNESCSIAFRQARVVAQPGGDE